MRVPRQGNRPLGAAVIVVTLTVGMLVAAAMAPASADPVLAPRSGVGADPPAPAVLALPSTSLPVAAKLADRCAFRFQSPPPAGVTILHVAPCGDRTSGTGTLDRPWGTIAQAMAQAGPGQVIYVHDDPALSVDYAEADLTPRQGGTGSPCTTSGAAARIRLLGAPGEAVPTVAKPAGATVAKPVLRLTQPWWLVEGLRIRGQGVARHSTVMVNGGCVVLRRMEVTASGTANAAVTFSASRDSALLDSHIWETVVGDAVTGRPAAVPTDATDHHGITVAGASDRVLVRGTHSYGHNGDSLQCGESTSTSEFADPRNISVEGNRFHQDEENAVDIKHCTRVSIRANKFFGYYPARPLATNRSPHGDAVVVHHNASSAGAAQVLVEQNRFFRNSRSVNIGTLPRQVTIRRNLVFDAKTDHCGIGAGIRASGRQLEIYHNTLDLLPGTQTRPGTGCTTWSTSERAAVRLTDQATSPRPVLWNNIISRAFLHLAANRDPSVLDSRTNLFDAAPTGGAPQGSIIGDPAFVADPANNDYFTRQGSPARDSATPVPASVLDPTSYCDDPAGVDTLAEPDIGFLESCF